VFENVILGIIQGVAEWLPISSEGLIVLIKTRFFGGGTLDDLVREALFLHLGTFLAALIYFRKDVKNLLSFSSMDKNTKTLFTFLAIATVISGVLGYFLLQTISVLEDFFIISGQRLMILIAILLVATGLLQLRVKKISLKDEKEISRRDGILLGLVQGLSVFPGLSRSGTTVATLMMRGYTNELALRLSFLMSLPIVLAGNVFLNLKEFTLTPESVVGFFFAFIFGLLTIDLLIKLSRKINFAFFVFIFAALSFAAAFI